MVSKVLRFQRNVFLECLRRLALGLALSTGLCYAVTASAQNVNSQEAAQKALTQVRQNIQLSQEKIANLINEVDGLKKDQKTLTSELVKAAAKEREASDAIASIEDQLPLLVKQKADVEGHLKVRRAEFAEVLAALERMGLNPPPAILIRPDDALKSVRSAVLLGSVVPQLRDQTLALTASLRELTTVTQKISLKRDQLMRQMTMQAEEQKKLSLLLNEKAKLQHQSESALALQRTQSEELALRAKSLEDLVTELERQEKLSARGAPSANLQLQLKAAPNFDQLYHQLIRPVSGRVVRQFGAGEKEPAQGETIEASLGGVVIAPADGVVVYAGAFRSYGKLVILDEGSGYHIVLAGLGEINVQQGQFVLAGEPIGKMSQQIIASAVALDIGKTVPMLYIEFRKNGKPVDPAPWWAHDKSGRKQNDS